jgi:hypothetical protein
MKAEGAIRNEQSRETGSIWYTRHKMKKNVRESRETSNIGNQNIFLEKKHNPPPLQVKWSFPKA